MMTQALQREDAVGSVIKRYHTVRLEVFQAHPMHWVLKKLSKKERV
jgi:hypothetical protein